MVQLLSLRNNLSADRQCFKSSQNYHNFGLVALVFLLWLLLSACQKSQKSGSPTPTVTSRAGVVVSANPAASEAGASVLRQGGNAFDAAVATHFALAVCYPRAGNLGGGGFLVYRQYDGKSGSLDFREKAPQNATRDMYLDSLGNPIPERSLEGGLAAGVPGSVAGMVKLHKRLGKTNWKTLLQPAIRLAEEGVVLSPFEVAVIERYQSAFRKWNPANCPFIGTFQPGDTLRQPALAATLRRIAERGRAGFYEGITAGEVVAHARKTGGILTQEDLSEYEAVWRDPIRFDYRNTRILSMPPPSSGGVALAQLLKGTEPYPLAEWKHHGFRHIHLMTELERRVYADRATYLGDTDFYPVPLDTLLSEGYLRKRFSDISLQAKTPSSEVKAGEVAAIESHETTHLCVVDKEGNAVSLTTTLNGNFGSKVWLPKSGFFLNNEMNDFSIKPGVPNQFGLVGGEANAIAPGKRMLSSMTPTIVEKDGRLWLVLGTPGGATIITTVYQLILNLRDFEMAPQAAMDSKRIHSQWLPDEIYLEEGAVRDSLVLQKLQQTGHQLRRWQKIGKAELILVTETGKRIGVPDHTRGDDTAVRE